MTNLTMPNHFSYINDAKKSVPGFEDSLRTPPRCMGQVWKKFQISNFDMPNNFFSMKYPLKSVSGLADVGVPHGVEDGPRTTPRCVGGSGKSFKRLIFTCLTMSLL